MQRLEVSGAVRPIYGSLGVKRLIRKKKKKKVNKTCTKYQKQIYIKSREMSQATNVMIHLGSNVQQFLKWNKIIKRYLTQRISATQGMNEGWARPHTDDRMDMRNIIHDFRNNFRKTHEAFLKSLNNYCGIVRCKPLNVNQQVGI